MVDDYDSPWKEILEGYLPEFMAFFFPDAHRDVDWELGYESLDAELQQVVRDAGSGRRLADKLFKVWLENGEERIVFIHIEVQGQHDEGFPRRMFTYNYRTFDHRQKPVVSFAVLGDDNPTWCPDYFGWEYWGCEVGIRFPVVKLRDYEGKWEELEASDNPFATVVMAHLSTKATRRDPEGRLEWKTRLVRRLYRGGYEREDVLELFRFIDWLLALPMELEERFQVELEQFEAELNMPYITNIERKGIQKGIQRGETTILRRQLTRRFEELPSWAEQRLESAGREELESWADRVLDAERLEDVFEPASSRGH